LTQEEVEDKLKQANLHRDEDEITKRVFELKEEISRLQKVINQDKISDNLLEKFKELQFAVSNHDVNQAEELVAELKMDIIAT
jgi:molecular chaperone DnaK